MGKMGEYERWRVEEVGATRCVWVFASEGTKPRLTRWRVLRIYARLMWLVAAGEKPSHIVSFSLQRRRWDPEALSLPLSLSLCLSLSLSLSQSLSLSPSHSLSPLALSLFLCLSPLSLALRCVYFLSCLSLGVVIPLLCIQNASSTQNQ